MVDGVMLDTAAWATTRLNRAILVDGGTRAQRRAVAAGIISRGGSAASGTAGGRLRLRWEVQTQAADGQ
ncbi:MAG: hypothetical protein EOP67_33115 [Sphingomonas sp.]|nr:MAG: hypothetical protein EOP67_33115 [Sphingomonas sp.]